MTRLKRAAGYLRRSTEGQESSIPEQPEEISPYAAKNSYEIVRWHEDDAITGDSIEERPGFSQMRNDCARGEFQFIICWDQKRFGRFDSIDGGYAVRRMRAAGASLRAERKNPGDRTMANQGGKRHGAEQIVRKLWDAEALLSSGKTIGKACQVLEVSEQTCHR